MAGPDADTASTGDDHICFPSVSRNARSVLSRPVRNSRSVVAPDDASVADGVPLLHRSLPVAAANPTTHGQSLPAVPPARTPVDTDAAPTQPAGDEPSSAGTVCARAFQTSFPVERSTT